MRRGVDIRCELLQQMLWGYCSECCGVIAAKAVGLFLQRLWFIHAGMRAGLIG